jgi:PRTRC genetic system protein C
MSSLTVKALHREFFYNGIRIPDPAPNLTVEQVRELLTPSYPEIATASLAGPEGILPLSAAFTSPCRARCATGSFIWTLNRISTTGAGGL